LKAVAAEFCSGVPRATEAKQHRYGHYQYRLDRSPRQFHTPVSLVYHGGAWVRERFDRDGFGAWTIKEGVPHVQPPVSVLENMLTLRLHLDRADAENGALIVLPGTQTMGRLPDDWVVPADAEERAVVCEAEAGDDILAFRPLLLHMSRKSARPSHRRVIQIEYAASPLPPPLSWYEQPDG